ncbi:Gfo/Idh/MocA family protein [Naasia sp. SYSU D00948]|uniref:Gfo/Idh/MocA family protein n=1 Tax=Naasia sp. SYSU D00948 TaxID=2817379 RepID=UPI001B3054F8|nr:Gfo/Idh/MocA family oxidoreductase [Naasia sp. SYSU D00948]
MDRRVVVVGAGWAGEGYTRAFRAAGVEVAAVCGRDEDAVRSMTARLDVPEARLDWRAAIEELRPDIVVVATPGRAHRDIATFAADSGCHVVCEKPLGLSAAEASEMLAAVRRSGVRHAYGSTSRYSPVVAEARDLLRSGIIGDPTEVEASAHFEMPRMIGYSWLHSVSEGGGLLFNVLPHFLGQVTQLLGGTARSVTGLADAAVERVPVGPVVHDFRQQSVVEAGEAIEWRAADGDTRATAIVGWETAGGGTVRSLWHASGLSGARTPGYLEVAGTDGTLHLSGVIWPMSLEYRRAGDSGWTAGPTPPEEYTDDPVQYGWNELVAQFMADVRGERDAVYPTFDEGLRDNEIIDIVRSSRSQPLTVT